MPIQSAQTTTDPEVEELNDRLATEHPIDDYYDRSPWIVRWVEQERLRIIREMIGDETELRIAEIGSGGGHILRMFPGAKLTAIDVSEKFLDTARKNLTGYEVEFIKGEVDRLRLPAQSFDRVICSEVLEHTKNPEAILSEIARLLKPKGWAVITVPNDALIDRLKGIVRRTPAGWLLKDRINWGGDIYHLHQWSPREFEALLSRHFQVETRASAPFNLLPLRHCARCRVRTV